MKRGLLIFALVIFLFSCNKEINPDPNPGSVPEKTELNVGYGTDALQKIDVYLPANRTTTTTKVIILVHGGGWSQGIKLISHLMLIH